MAKIDMTGLDDVLIQLEKVGNIKTVIPDMLNAGADVLVTTTQEETPVDTGEMRDAIIKSAVYDGDHIDVFPDGVDSKGVRNATKAFVTEYGKHNKAANPFMRRALQKSRQEIIDAETEVAMEYLNE